MHDDSRDFFINLLKGSAPIDLLPCQVHCFMAETNNYRWHILFGAGCIIVEKYDHNDDVDGLRMKAHYIEYGDLVDPDYDPQKTIDEIFTIIEKEQ
jgi:hypothetical protein